MPAGIVLKLIVTGVVAIVPSAKDPNLTRLIAPDASTIHLTSSSGEHAVLQEHLAFLEVREKNYQASATNRPPDFRYPSPDLADPGDRLVFILRSEVVKLDTTPTNLTLTDETRKPADLGNPAADEKDSTAYRLELPDFCPTCRGIRPEFFDLPNHPDLVAARMDLTGGKVSTRGTDFNEVWHIQGTPPIDQPLAQGVVYEFAVPGTAVQLTQTRFVPGSRTGEDRTLELISPDTQPIEVTFGNEPLRTIMLLDRLFPASVGRDQHLNLVYDLFATSPSRRPLPELVVANSTGVRLGGDNCYPPTFAAEDPTTP